MENTLSNHQQEGDPQNEVVGITERPEIPQPPQIEIVSNEATVSSYPDGIVVHSGITPYSTPNLPLATSSSLEDIPPPKADYYAPPPYEEVTQTTKLPTYEEVQREKNLEDELLGIPIVNDMAPPSESENVYASSKMVFECCKTRESNYMMCINCGKIYHKSCATRDFSSKVKFLDESRLTCCGEDITAKHQVIIAKQKKKIQDMGNLLSHLEQKIKMHKEKGKKSVTDVEYLKMLVTETTEKNELLKENNCLLLEKIKLLEHQIQSAFINPATTNKCLTQPEQNGKNMENGETTNDLSCHSQTNHSEIIDETGALVPGTSARPTEGKVPAGQTHDLEAADNYSEGSVELAKTKRQKQKRKQKKKKNIKHGEKDDNIEFSSSSKQ